MRFLDLRSGRRRNIIAQANTLRRSLDGFTSSPATREIWWPFHFESELEMKTAVALIFVSIIDLPSIVSILGAIAALRFWQVGVAVIFASILGELLTAMAYISYNGPEFFLYRLIGQAIVGFSIFSLVEKYRKTKSLHQSNHGGMIFYYSTVLLAALGVIGLFTTLILQETFLNPEPDAELKKLNAEIRENIDAQEKQNKIDLIK